MTGSNPMPPPNPAPAPAPGPRKTALSVLFLIVFIDLLGFAIVLPLLPRYAERFHASSAVIGLLMSSFSAMQFLFAPLWGRLSDRIGRRPVLLAGLAGSVVFYALFGAAVMIENLPLIFAARIGAGICGATIPTAQAYIADSTGMGDRARGMALVGAAFGMGFTFGPILGSVSMGGAPIPGAPPPLNAAPGFLASGLSLGALLLALVWLPESRRGSGGATRHAWLDVATIRGALRVPSVGLLLLLFFVATFAFAQFENTLSLLTARAFRMSDCENFYLFAYLGVTLSVAQGGLVRFLAPRVGEPRLVIAGTVLMGAGLWLVGESAGRSTPWFLVGALPVVICGFSFLTPSTQALVSRRTDPGRQGEIFGVTQSASALARILGPFLGNVLFGIETRLPYRTSALLLAPVLLLALRSVNAGRDWPAPPANPPAP